MTPEAFDLSQLAPESEGNPDILANKYERFGLEPVTLAPRGNFPETPVVPADAEINDLPTTRAEPSPTEILWA